MSFVRYVFLALIATSLLPISAAEASDPLRLPSSELFENLFDAIEEPVRDLRWQCGPSRDSRCDCVVFAVGESQVALYGVERRTDELRADYLVVFFEGERFMARDVIAGITEDALTLSHGPGIWEPAEDLDQVLSVDRGMWVTDDAEPSVIFEELRWSSAATVGDEAGICASDMAGFSEDLDAISAGADRASAKRATLSDSADWRVGDFRLTQWPPLPIAANTDANRSAGGFFPPTLFVHSDGALVSGAYHLGEIPLTLYAHADSSVVVGGGIGVWSSSPLCDEPSCEKDSLAVDFFGSAEGPEAIYLSGSAAIGSPRLHASMASDGLGWMMGHYDPDRVNRLQRDTFFQNWRAQRVGLTLSSENHDLLIGGASFGDIAPDREGLQPSSHDTTFWMSYGTRLELGSLGRADLRLQHREMDISDSASWRMSHIVLRLDDVYGDLQRAYIRPALVGEVSAAVVDGSDGAEAGSRSHLDAVVDGGLALRGELGDLRHLVSPRIFLGRRLVAGDTLPESVPDAGGDGFFEPPESPFNFAGIALDQHLNFPSGMRLSMPASVTFLDDGAGRDWRSISQLSLEHAASTAQKPLVVGVDGICAGWCEEIGVRGRVHIGWSDQIESVHSAGWGLQHRPGGPSMDRRLRGAFSEGFGPIPIEDDIDADRIVHTSAIRGRWRNWRAQLGIFGDMRHPENGGAQIEGQRFWEEAGWGVGVQVAALPAERDWAAMVGFSTRR